jgi:hypothetical protein
MGAPSRSNTAVTVELMDEPAAIRDGLAERDKLAATMDKEVDSVIAPHSAVIIAVPTSVPGTKVTDAYP